MQYIWIYTRKGFHLSSLDVNTFRFWTMWGRKVRKVPPNHQSKLTLLKRYTETSSIHGGLFTRLKEKILYFYPRGSVSIQQISHCSSHLADLSDSCSGGSSNLRQKCLLRLEDPAHNHQPEDDVQTSERAWLSFGHDLQGRAEHARCERGASKGKNGLGSRKEGEEGLFRIRIRSRLLPTYIQ